jgi:hypothetical protein
MYVGDLMVLAGEAVLFRSGWMVLYAALVWLVLDQFIRRYEEPTLQRRHGAEYLRYLRAGAAVVAADFKQVNYSPHCCNAILEVPGAVLDRREN